ncbi:MAG: zinc ABC transporter substrate-binding protein [Pseudomonadota bacterium]
MNPSPDSPKKTPARVWLATLAFLAALALFPLAASASGEALRVFVSIAPQEYFVKRVGGDRVAVTVMVPPGASPATYEPRPRQMAGLSTARLYLAVGVPFETAWLPRFASANPAMRVVRTEEGIGKVPMARHHHEEEADHEGEGSGGHGVLDPHVWTSPPLVKILAKNIASALALADPAGREAYGAGYRDFARDLDELDAEFKAIFSGAAHREFMVFHPAWGYFAQAYGLVQVPVEIEGKEPKPGQLADMIDEARHRGIRVIFVQPQNSRRAAQAVAKAVGARLVTADPLAADWMENIRKQAAAFARALEKE